LTLAGAEFNVSRKLYGIITLSRGKTQVWHDYKPLRNSTTKTRRLPWFVLGLGLPFLALGLLSWLIGSVQRVDQGPFADQEDYQVTGMPIELPGLGSAPAQVAVAPVTTGIPEAAESAVQTLQLEIRPGDSLDSLFGRHGLSRSDLAAIMGLKGAREHLRLVHPGDTITVQHMDGRVKRLSRDLDETRTLEVSASQDGRYQTSMSERPLETRVVYGHGVIESSLFEAGKEAGISDKVIMNLAGIFAWDVDFVLDIRQGDAFVVLYEELWQDGVKLRDGEILASEFVNSGKSFRAIKYTDSGGRTDYYTPEGDSMRKAFIRAPVDFSRISSNFNMKRKHPILNRIRAHKGVDYAAPKGTPIKAAGDGKVIFAGQKGGYGNCVIVQHGGNITTLYAHMSRFSKLARVGKRVSQGEVIGYVGSSGLATAAHLHYEYRVNGVHRNPRTVKLPQANPIAPEYRHDYLARADAMMSQLDMVRRTRMAAVAAE